MMAVSLLIVVLYFYNIVTGITTKPKIKVLPLLLNLVYVYQYFV